MKKRTEKVIKTLYIISGLIPVVFILYTSAFYFYALKIHSIQLSHGVYANNESVYEGAKIASVLFGSSMYSMLILFPAILFCNIVLTFYKNVELNVFVILGTAISFIFCIVALYMRPVCNVLEWIMD